MTKQIGIIVGSARKNAFSQLVAEAIAPLFPEDVEVVFPKISDLDMFNQDYDDEGATPSSWVRFRSEVKELDGVLIVTPEHNRSMPALLKNALDIASRPYGENVWSGKPGAVLGVSPGAMGGFGAVHDVRTVASFLNLQLLNQPEVYLGQVTNFIKEDGTLKEDTIGFLQSVVDAYMAWFDQVTK